jgi:hypothetical protein
MPAPSRQCKRCLASIGNPALVPETSWGERCKAYRLLKEAGFVNAAELVPMCLKHARIAIESVRFIQQRVTQEARRQVLAKVHPAARRYWHERLEGQECGPVGNGDKRR